MSSDSGDGGMTEFQLEEIAMGRGEASRRRLNAIKDNSDRVRLDHVRAEIDRFQHALSEAGDVPGVTIPSDEVLARYLDHSLIDEGRIQVESALAGSHEARRRLIQLHEDVRAATVGESLPRVDVPDGAVLPYTRATDSNRTLSTAPLAIPLGGLIAAVLAWMMSAFGPAVLQTPLGFAVVACIAWVVMHRSSESILASMARSNLRVLQVGIAVVGGAGLVLGVSSAGFLSAACALTAASFIALVASLNVSASAIPESTVLGVPAETSHDESEVESRDQGSGGA